MRVIKIISICSLLKIIRLLKIKTIAIKLENFFTSQEITTMIIVLRCFVIIFLISHWTACGMYYIGFESTFDFGDNYLTHADILDMSVEEKYITALYWSLSTITTVGYGDVIP
jgi:hypothetical protein